MPSLLVAVLGVAMQRIASLLLRGELVRTVGRTVAVVACACLATGCGWLGLAGHSSNSAGSWLASGSLTLSRPAPAVSSSDRARLNSGDLTSTLSTTDAPKIVISRSDRTITALSPGSPALTFRVEGAQHLASGSFSVTLKEDNPLWYAPDEYFTRRALRVPEQGSRSRFLRAALGHSSLYLNDQTPIHSGPVWLEEIGGLRLTKQEFDQLAAVVTVGTRVEIR